MTATVAGGAGSNTFKWSNGASTPSITVSPSITTTYFVVVTTPSGCNSDPASGTVTILPNPTCGIGTPVAAGGGSDVLCGYPGGVAGNTLAATLVTGATYNWSLTGPSGWSITAGQGTRTVTFTSGSCGIAGTKYSFGLTVTDANGCVSTCQKQFDPVPFVAPCNANAPDAVLTCFSPEVELQGSTTVTGFPVTYSWTGPGIVSGGNTATPTVNMEGNYILTVRVATGTEAASQCKDTATVTLVAPDLGNGNGSLATVFELDGNVNAVMPNPPDDWSLIFAGTSSADFTTGIVTDFPSNADNAFVQGAKDLDDVTTWNWQVYSTPDKNDLLNAGAALYGSKLYFFGDRYAVNGSAQVGFWFFHDRVVPEGDETFSGEHMVGDLLILSDFIQGGGTPVIYAYKWVGSGGSDGALDKLTLSGSNSYALVNTNNGSTPWPYASKFGASGMYPNGALFEGGIDLGAFPDIDPCFASFQMETRASASVSAELKDFVAGEFFFNLNSSKRGLNDAMVTNNGDFESMIKAYPNPSSSLTTFEFSVKQDAQVSLEVYNATGMSVALLFEQTATAGIVYKIDFNATELSRGIYFYKFITDGKERFGKLVIMR